MVGDALQQVPVVRDHHERAGPAVQDVFHGSQGVGVQIVGGLIEHQHVRFSHQQAQQLQPAALTAGQFLHGSPLALGVEAQLLHELAGGEFAAAHAEDPLLVLDDLDDAHVRHLVEFLDFLRQHRRLHGGAALQPALGRLNFAVEQAQQRGLAGAVDTHQAQALPRGQAQGDVLEQLRVAQGQGHFLEVQHVLAQAGGGHLVQ